MSTFDRGFAQGWGQRSAYEDLERERAAELAKPFRGNPNPPELMAPTRCRVLKPFGLAGGKVAQVDEIVELQRHDALSMAALRRVEIIV